MKTRIIEVTDMLSILTVDEVEKRLGKVSGVESATVNYAAGNATVRYDETLVNVADIKVMVHQREPQSNGEPQLKQKSEHQAAPAPAQKAAAPKNSPDSLAVAPSTGAIARDDDHKMQDAAPLPAAHTSGSLTTPEAS